MKNMCCLVFSILRVSDLPLLGVTLYTDTSKQAKLRDIVAIRCQIFSERRIFVVNSILTNLG